MKIVTNEACDDLALKLGMVALDLLNNALKEHGITSKQKREQICSSVYFGVGSFFDSCWIEHRRGRYRPVLAFIDHKALDIPPTELLLPDPEQKIPFHEVAHFEAGAFFGARTEDTSDIKTGEIYDQS